MKTVTLLLSALALAASACGGGGAPEQGAGARPTATVRPAPASTAATTDEFATVRADYAKTCINCHKADGTGGAVELEGGKTLKVPSLLEAGRRDSDEELAEQIRSGGGGMPAFKNRLDEKQINDLVRFIRKEFHGR